MRKLGTLVRGNRKVVVLFVLMVLLPAAAFSVLLLRAFRGEEARSEYDKQQRQRQIVRLVEADLRNWLFSTAAPSARADAILAFDVAGERVVFPEFGRRYPQASRRDSGRSIPARPRVR